MPLTSSLEWRIAQPLVAVMPRLVVFEGLDGTGKTRMSRLLAERFHAVHAATPAPEFAELRRALHDFGGRPSFFMYLAACAYALESGIRSGTSALFIDRFWFSSVVHHAWATDATDHSVKRLIQWVTTMLPFPHVTAILHSAPEIREERLVRRGDRGLGPRSADYQAVWERCLACLRDVAPAAAAIVDVDTSDRDEVRVTSALAIAIEPVIPRPAVRANEASRS